MDSSGSIGRSVEADAFFGCNNRGHKLRCEGQVVRCFRVVFNGTGWSQGWIVDTGIHRAGFLVAGGQAAIGRLPGAGLQPECP